MAEKIALVTPSEAVVAIGLLRRILKNGVSLVGHAPTISNTLFFPVQAESLVLSEKEADVVRKLLSE